MVVSREIADQGTFVSWQGEVSGTPRQSALSSCRVLVLAYALVEPRQVKIDTSCELTNSVAVVLATKRHTEHGLPSRLPFPC